MNYIRLPGGHVRRCDDTLQWARWFQKTENRVVARTPLTGGGIVSTVFLGVDHNFRAYGPPVLWETMVFGGEHDGEQRRYTSEVAALAGHEEIVEACGGRA